MAWYDRFAKSVTKIGTVTAAGLDQWIGEINSLGLGAELGVYEGRFEDCDFC
jgi:hypothetical protein